MAEKEAKARIKINRLLEESGWRFFDDATGKANITLESSVKLSKAAINELGENFEKTSNGFTDFLLLDENGKPLLVLEAKSESKTRWSARSRRGNTPSTRNAASSSSPTATCTTSGICSKATRTSSRATRHRIRSRATTPSSPTRNA